MLVRAVKSNKNFGCSEDNERLRAKDQMFSSKRCPFCRDVVRTAEAVSQQLVQTKVDVLKQLEHRRAFGHLPTDFKFGRMAQGPSVY